jgi:hypothetical protein
MGTALPVTTVLIIAFAGTAYAQAGSPSAAADGVVPAELQVRAAVAALPAQFRDNATVLGYQGGAAGLVQLRAGDGPFICLADNPKEARFHVACYHRSLEPLMARGRELRAGGVTGEAVDSVRKSEAASGKLKLPAQPAALYSLTAQSGTPDAQTGLVTGARALHVIYVPFATAESTGLTTQPSPGQPWLMGAGTFKAHIMFTPAM